MTTIVSCKHCGEQISLLGMMWYDQDILNRMYCKVKGNPTEQLHEPFVPEPEDELSSDWKMQMHRLLTVMKMKNRDHVAYFASKMFITKEGKPNKTLINEFEAFAPCKIKPGLTFGEEWKSAIIAYNGYYFEFGNS